MKSLFKKIRGNKKGFTLAELTAVMAGFDTHPQAGK